MENPIPRILKTPILAMYHDDKSENLTLEVELPDVESENITLVIHENSFYLKAFSNTAEYMGAFFLDGPVDLKGLLLSIIKECSQSMFPIKNVLRAQEISLLNRAKNSTPENVLKSLILYPINIYYFYLNRCIPFL